MSNTGKLTGKLIISGQIELKTGLHIGTNKDTLEIGGVDNPVIRDPLTREPYIPGSSLKGKLRSLLERAQFSAQPYDNIEQFYNKTMTTGNILVRHHECSDESCTVCRLFGASTGAGINENRPGRLITEDCRMTGESKEQLEAIDTGLYLTEQKSENTLDRITSAANPRQQERVPRGTSFSFTLIYTADTTPNNNLFKADIRSLFTALRLLEDDALGGSGSRGYGRIAFKDLKAAYRPLEYYTEAKDEVIISQNGETLMAYAEKVLSTLE
ncbi:MAG: type III-A CRISPR-associated RAMP protein Csm3 [Firmicutes bacterium]|nr:type III-A CRISPR-associated RAMP protein Csm3 [Bacillota bacterium]